jgi:hypothetical protein
MALVAGRPDVLTDDGLQRFAGEMCIECLCAEVV